MREEIENWWKQAKKDLTAANNSLKSGDYEWACFQAHQSVEKAIKALYMLKKRRSPFTHDLTKMGRELKFKKELMISLIELNPEITKRKLNRK